MSQSISAVSSTVPRNACIGEAGVHYRSRRPRAEEVLRLAHERPDRRRGGRLRLRCRVPGGASAGRAPERPCLSIDDFAALSVYPAGALVLNFTLGAARARVPRPRPRASARARITSRAPRLEAPSCLEGRRRPVLTRHVLVALGGERPVRIVGRSRGALRSAAVRTCAVRLAPRSYGDGARDRVEPLSDGQLAPGFAWADVSRHRRRSHEVRSGLPRRPAARRLPVGGLEEATQSASPTPGSVSTPGTASTSSQGSGEHAAQTTWVTSSSTIVSGAPPPTCSRTTRQPAAVSRTALVATRSETDRAVGPVECPAGRAIHTRRWCSSRSARFPPECRAGARALDLGCGTGVHTVFLAENGFSVVAVDISTVAVETTRRRLDAAGLMPTLEVTLDRCASCCTPASVGPRPLLRRPRQHRARDRTPSAVPPAPAMAPRARGAFLFAAEGDFRVLGDNPYCLHGYRQDEVHGLFADGSPKSWSTEPSPRMAAVERSSAIGSSR